MTRVEVSVEYRSACKNKRNKARNKARVSHEFNTKLNQFKIIYAVKERKICFLKHKEMFSRVKLLKLLKLP